MSIVDDKETAIRLSRVVNRRVMSPGKDLESLSSIPTTALILRNSLLLRTNKKTTENVSS